VFSVVTSLLEKNLELHMCFIFSAFLLSERDNKNPQPLPELYCKLEERLPKMKENPAPPVV